MASSGKASSKRSQKKTAQKFNGEHKQSLRSHKIVSPEAGNDCLTDLVVWHLFRKQE